MKITLCASVCDTNKCRIYVCVIDKIYGPVLSFTCAYAFNMYRCIEIYIHIDLCISTHIYRHIYIFIYMHVNTHLFKYLCIYMYIYI